VRFLGKIENSREVKKDYEEMRERIQKGERLYGNTKLSEFYQMQAMKNTTNSVYTSRASVSSCLPPSLHLVT
jgi:hypothetical protein